jgi:hypothetical protein
MGCEPGLFGGRPCGSPGLCWEHVSVYVVVRLRLPFREYILREVIVVQVPPLKWWLGRAVGLDLHRDFIQIAICGEGLRYNAGRVPITSDGLESLAASHQSTDRVVMEAVARGRWPGGLRGM